MKYPNQIFLIHPRCSRINKVLNFINNNPNFMQFISFFTNMEKPVIFMINCLKQLLIILSQSWTCKCSKFIFNHRYDNISDFISLLNEDTNNVLDIIQLADFLRMNRFEQKI